MKILQSCFICFKNSLFKPVKVKDDVSCLYRAVALHIISFCLNDIWTDRFSLGKKSGTQQAILKVVNDLKDFIFQKDNENDIIALYFYADQDVHDFIKSKTLKWDLAME